MHNSHQIDCLQALGVQYYGLKSSEQALISKGVYSDLQILFPNMRRTDNDCQLSLSLKWVIDEQASSIEKTSNQIISQPIESMDLQQKRQFWSVIQEHATHKPNETSE